MKNRRVVRDAVGIVFHVTRALIASCYLVENLDATGAAGQISCSLQLLLTV
jgi:hypothetical protein